jgi:hypothetical protein
LFQAVGFDRVFLTNFLCRRFANMTRSVCPPLSPVYRLCGKRGGGDATTCPCSTQPAVMAESDNFAVRSSSRYCSYTILHISLVIPDKSLHFMFCFSSHLFYCDKIVFDIEFMFKYTRSIFTAWSTCGNDRAVDFNRLEHVQKRPLKFTIF